MKKIISALAAAVMLAAFPAINAAAEETEAAAEQDATFCFDTDSSLALLENYGSIKETGLALSISSDNKESGDGSLCIYENITEEIPADQQFGGVYFTAETLGMEDFKGCTVQMSVLFDEAAKDVADKFTVYSDGIVWTTAEISADTAGRWTKVALTVPENAANDKLGFTIPVYGEYTGNVAYVDNIIVYNPDGTIAANVGDYQLTSAGLNVPASLGARIAMIVGGVLLIVAAIGGVGFVVTKLMRKFV